MKRHLLFAFVLVIGIIATFISLVPILMGDCGASTHRNRALHACLEAQGREIDLFVIVWLLTLANLIWQHGRRTRHIFVSYLMFVILPVTCAIILAQSQVEQWRSLDLAR